MNTAAAAGQIACPRCSDPLTPEDGAARCLCGWRGDVLLFDPAPRTDVDQASVAMPEDSVCVHHPNKRAEVVCTGTGDYICSLCAIEVGGKTYSAAFINRGGVTDLAEHFDRRLPRPDRFIIVLVLLSLIPLSLAAASPYLAIAGAIPWGWALYKYAHLRRLRRENQVLRRMVGTSTVYLLPVVLAAWALMYLVFVSVSISEGFG